jgi:serine/threonine-protein kinase RsbW
VLKSGRSASGQASEWARPLAEKAGLSEERVYALDLCIVELVSNVVNHSYRGADGEIRIDLVTAGPSAILVVTDEGPAFDPLSVPPPPIPKSLDEATLGGYGVHMVRTTSDGCRYERRGNQNVFTAWFGG